VRKDGIDASLGLAFSLELFKRYRQSGLLQAEIPRVPGIGGRCHAFLHLAHGEVVAVYLEDRQKHRYSSDKEFLCRLDKEKGPFEWTLTPQSANSEQPPPAGQFQPPPSAPPTSRSPVPRVITALREEWLSNWTLQQKEPLYIVLSLINGERTVEDIKAATRFPPNLVDELLRILLRLNVIAISAE
jgi:hypothetical protein